MDTQLPSTPALLTIAEAAALIRTRQLSPVDLAAAAFKRIAALDHQLNSHILVLEDEGMAAAKVAEAEIRYRVVPFPNDTLREQMLATARRIEVPERFFHAA